MNIKYEDTGRLTDTRWKQTDQAKTDQNGTGDYIRQVVSGTKAISRDKYVGQRAHRYSAHMISVGVLVSPSGWGAQKNSGKSRRNLLLISAGWW